MDPNTKKQLSSPEGMESISTDDQILADFFEAQSHSIQPEIVQATSESHARVERHSQAVKWENTTKSISRKSDDQDEEVVETIVEVYGDSESDSSEPSKAKQNLRGVDEPLSAIQILSHALEPKSHRPLTTAMNMVTPRTSASAPSKSENKSMTMEKRPSTSRTFRRKLKRLDPNNVKTQSQPTRPHPATTNVGSGRSKSAPRTRHQVMEHSHSPAERPSTAGPTLQNFTAARQESAIEIFEDMQSPTSSRIGSAKLAVRNRLAHLFKVEIAVRGMRDDVRRNLFSPSLQILEATLFWGSLLFMVPFTIQIRNGEFSLEGGAFRTTIVGILLLSSTLLHASVTYASVKMATLKDVLSVTGTIDNAALLFVLLAFGYSVLFCRSRYRSLFETFGTRFLRDTEKLRQQRWKIIIWTLLPFLLCIGMGNWIAWGASARLSGLATTFGLYYNQDTISLFPNCPVAEHRFKIFVASLQMFLETYAQCVVMYTELMLWAASLSLYWMEKKKRAYCIQDNVAFDLVQGTTLFRDLLELVNRRLSKPLGPLLAISCVSLVTFNVSGMTILCFDEWRWHIPIIMVIKVGHVLMAAEATANDENLLNNILTKRISSMPPICASGRDEAAILHSRLNFERQLREFKDVVREPMALKALDFADINYALFGWVLVSVIGYFLVVAEWLRGP